ncbi:MAG: hypothetical protein V4585_11560 [Bacteroidota bacterium]|jgi:hypothetical protein
MKHSLFKSFTTILFISFCHCAFPQNRPKVEWRVKKIENNKNDASLLFSFATEKGWTLYAINHDTLNMKISAKIKISPNDECYSLNGSLTASNAITKYDDDLDLNLSYFNETGVFSQPILVHKTCVVDVEIIYLISKQINTVAGDGGILYKMKDSMQVQLE